MSESIHRRGRDRGSIFYRIANQTTHMIWSVFILCVMIYCGGFIVYLAEYQRAAEPLFDQADAIVVLTGGPDRIAEAAKLLNEKRASHLLISGVNEQTDEDDLVRATPMLAKFMACCVTIDRDAQNTHENALQTLAWMKHNQFNSMILVTAHAHMPRALFELRIAGAGDLSISPWRVGGQARPEDWWHDSAMIRAMLLEYTKLSGAVLRYLIITLKDEIIESFNHA